MSRLLKNISSSYVEAANKFNKISRSGVRVVYVYVEGYDDIAFWRDVLSNYESSTLTFEVNVPAREDLAKGKKVLLNMYDSVGESLVLCMDSDFDYIFGRTTPQGRLVNGSEYIFQTYVYAIENYLCYPPSLRSLAVKATKNDKFIFDFEAFMKDYSVTVYPLFLWYIYSAYLKNENFFPLIDFKNSVKLHFLEVENNGFTTIEWLKRQCARKEKSLSMKNPQWVSRVHRYGQELNKKGVTPENIYYFMHGHTLFDNVVTVILESVCEVLKVMTIDNIRSGTKTGIALSNELSNYKNTIRSVSNIMQDNDGYKNCPMFKMLKDRLDAIFVKKE